MNDPAQQPVPASQLVPAMQQPMPKINDQYWFNYSESLVTNGLENRNKAASTIQNFIVWLWAIYTGFASVGFALSGKELVSWQAAFIALASVSIIAVYAGTVWVQIPVTVPFDPRSPDDIEGVYLTNMRSKTRRLRVTLGLSILAAIMVSMSLIVASVAKPQKAPEKPVSPSLSAAIVKRDGEARHLAVTGVVGKTTPNGVIIRFNSLVPPMKSAKSNSYTYLPSAEGLVQASIPIDEKIKEAHVSAEWEDPTTGIQMHMSKTVRVSQ